MNNNSVKNKVISLLTNGLQKGKLLRKNHPPQELEQHIDLNLGEHGVTESELTQLIDQIVDKSVNTNHSLFMNQMYGKMNPIAVYGDVLTTMLNTSMYTYEVAPLLTLIEKECISKLTKYLWKNGFGDGVFTPGGSISNLKGLMLARNAKIEEVKTEGLDHTNYSIFVSDQAHYSFLKSAVLLGFGSESVVKIPSNKKGQIKLDALKTSIATEKAKGRIPLMLVGVAGSTFSGVFDDLASLAQIAEENNMWYHVDAVYGGSLLFSKEERYKFIGIDHADSVSWNLHKVMGIPLICSAFLTKQHGLLNEAFTVDADYLFHNEDDLDLGQKSIQCGRRVDALKLWMAWKHDGNIGFANRINGLMNAVNAFAENIKLNNHFELLCEPQSPIIIFRYTQSGYSNDELNEINKAIRNELFKKGNMLFNYSEFKGNIYLRCVISDPELSNQTILELIQQIEEKGEVLAPKKSTILI